MCCMGSALFDREYIRIHLQRVVTSAVKIEAEIEDPLIVVLSKQATNIDKNSFF